ncbi:MAG: hypothetical protein HUJ29_13585 [Gammaproteobacteria bacterium]|nr:hypothetical protein [Gammaproteobacteria bacterium]
MSLETEIRESEGLVVHTITGELSLDEVKQATVRLFSNPAFRPDMSILVDLREGTANALSQQDLDDFVELTQAMDEKRGNGRSAILAARDVDFGIGRILQALLDGSSRSLQVFRDYKQALKWLLAPR